jgi:hypothetical protein
MMVGDQFSRDMRVGNQFSTATNESTRSHFLMRKDISRLTPTPTGLEFGTTDAQQFIDGTDEWKTEALPFGDPEKKAVNLHESPSFG